MSKIEKNIWKQTKMAEKMDKKYLVVDKDV